MCLTQNIGKISSKIYADSYYFEPTTSGISRQTSVDFVRDPKSKVQRTATQSPMAKYIENQEIHHRKKSFRAEYLELLRKFEVEYDERYVFEFFDDVQGWE